MAQDHHAMPALFVGHGSPMQAITDSVYAHGWRALAAQFPKPRAIVAVSAHWFTQGTAVTTSTKPRTIHDFGGFPRALHEVEYPAPGDPALAQRICELGRPVRITGTDEWGLDHGTWSVLIHMYPAADVPVVQLSMDARLPAAAHYALGQRLSTLRDEGVLVLGSGNVVHNLGLADWQPEAPARSWATEFQTLVRHHVESADDQPLIDYAGLGEAARLSIPTAEHYLPLLYVLGLRRATDRASTYLDSIDMGSIGMLSVAVGL